MNTQTTLYAIDRDLNALYHERQKGQRKGVHQFGRWQRNTVYAQGRPDPNAKPREKSSSDSGKKEGALTRAKNAVVGAKARHDAKNDAAMDVTLNSKKYTVGERCLNRHAAIAGLAGGAIGGAMGAATNVNIPLVSPEVFKLGLSAFAGAGLGKAGTDAVQQAQYEGYLKREQGTLKGTKVSPTYREAYSKTFDEYKKKYSKPIGNRDGVFKAAFERNRAETNAYADAYNNVYKGAKPKGSPKNASMRYKKAYTRAYNQAHYEAREEKKETDQYRREESHGIKGQQWRKR